MTRYCFVLFALVLPILSGPGRAQELPAGCSAANLEIEFTGSCRDLDMSAVPEVERTNRAYGPPPDAGPGPFPLIVQLPGGGAAFDSTQWAALRLAEAGYIVVNIDPSGAGTGTQAYADAVSATIDFLDNPDASPYHAFIDFERIGSTGWSLGAHAQVLINNDEPRVDAVAAFDTLASTSEGDIGSQRACVLGQIPTGGELAEPRVPALGFTVEACNNPPPGSTYERTITGWQAWQAAGIDAMLQTLNGAFANAEPSNHFWFSSNGPELAHDLIARYTIAWFDYHLKDIDRTDQLLACNGILGGTIEEVLTDEWASAVHFAGQTSADFRVDCRSLDVHPSGSEDRFIRASYLLAGTGPADAAGRGIDLTTDGDAVVTGSFSGVLDLEGQAELTSAGDRDGVLMRLDRGGEIVWLQQFGAAGGDFGFNLALGPDDRIAVSGIFSDTVDFGGQTLTAEGAGGGLSFLGEDMFVAIFDGRGALEQLTHFAGPDTVGGNEIAWTADGGLVVIGNGFGTVRVPGTDLSVGNRGGQDALVARLDAGGLPLWLRPLGATGDDQGRAIAVDDAGAIYFAGQFEGQWLDGDIAFSSRGSEDGLIVSLAADGGLRWARQIGGVGTDRVRGLAVLDDRLIAVGEFSGTIEVGGEPRVAAGGRDVFVLELSTADGTFEHWLQLGGPGDDEGGEIELQSDGERVIAGNFSDTARFGAFELNSAGGRDWFVARIDPLGSVREIRHARSNADAFAIDVAADDFGFAVTGNHEGVLELNGRSTPEAAGNDLHVAMLDAGAEERLVPLSLFDERALVLLIVAVIVMAWRAGLLLGRE